MRQFPKGKVIAAAVVLGLVTAGMVYSFLSRQAVEAREYIPVVAAKDDIPVGSVVSADSLGIRRVPRDRLPAGAALSPQMVVGQVARKAIRAGEPVSLDSLVPKNRLSLMVPPMMRAVTVALDPIIGVGGFLKPGDHVDVLATFDINDGTVTKTVLQNVELLATGSEVTAEEINPKTGKLTGSKTQPNATLAVMPMDAEKLILAESKGKLRLSLRRPDDMSFTHTKGVTGRGVVGAVPPDVPEDKKSPAAMQAAALTPPMPVAAPQMQPIAPKAAPVTRTAAPKTTGKPDTGKTIQIIRGTKVEETVVPE